MFLCNRLYSRNSYHLKLTKMRAELASLSPCAVPFLNRAAISLCWYYCSIQYSINVSTFSIKETDIVMIRRVVFRVPSTVKTAQWYRDTFGMHIDTSSNEFMEAHFSESSTRLRFVEAGNKEEYVQDSNSAYWKIGITMGDVDLAVKRLREKSINVSDPKQFKEIGYLCHLVDINGFTIELLQHTFQNNFDSSKTSLMDSSPIGQPAVLGQITFRCIDMKEVYDFYQDKCNMKLLSVQDVSEYGFCLYFFAFTSEDPPDAQDLSSVANREWLWQRPYTTIEIQHCPAKRILKVPEAGVNFDRLVLQSLTEASIKVEGIKVDVLS